MSDEPDRLTETAPAEDVDPSVPAPADAVEPAAPVPDDAGPPAVEPAPVDAVDAAGAAGDVDPGRPVDEPAMVGDPDGGEQGEQGEQIEWQPVATGEQIEWQPVMSSEADTGTEQWHEPVSYEDYDDQAETTDAGEGWDPDPGPSAAANGAAGRYAAGRGVHPAPRRPPARRGPAASRRPAPSRSPAKEEEAEDEEGLPSKTKRQVIILSLLTVLVVGAGIAGFVLFRDASKTGSEATGGLTDTTVPRTGVTIPESQMQQVHDPVTNFTLKVPKTWENRQPPVGDIRLVMAAGENDGIRIRILPIQTPATIDNIGNFKEVTDAIVFGDLSAKLLQEQLIRVNNNLAYHYVYTFKDPMTGIEGVHAHYFIFEGNRMFSVVFQTLPTDDFRRLAPVFDQVAESFTIGPAPTTTTTPPTTTP